MKLKVVGWTCYDFDHFPEGDSSWAAHMAVVDDIQQNGYLFSGEDHQERLNCCPVFNDGKVRRFSQRGFASIMAEAHGDTGYMDYALYMFGLKLSNCRFPNNTVQAGDFPVETHLAETFTVELSPEAFSNAPTVETKTFFGTTTTKTVVKLANLPQLRYIDVGDKLVLTCGNQQSCFEVVDVDRDRDLTEEQRIDFLARMNYTQDENARKLAQEQFVALPVVITLTVK